MELHEKGRAVDTRDLPDSPKEPPYLMKIVRRMDMNNDELEEVLNSIINKLSQIDYSLYPTEDDPSGSPDKEPIRSFHSEMLTKLERYGNLVAKAFKINEGLKRLVG